MWCQWPPTTFCRNESLSTGCVSSFFWLFWRGLLKKSCRSVVFEILLLFRAVFVYHTCVSSVSGLTILNERTAQCQSALGKLQRGRKAKPSMRLSTCLIHTKERALKHKSLLVSTVVLSQPNLLCLQSISVICSYL